MARDDDILVLMGTPHEALMRAIAEHARLPEVLGDIIMVDARDAISAGEAMSKMMLSIDREMRHPKEQTQPRSPKQRFRKGR